MKKSDMIQLKPTQVSGESVNKIYNLSDLDHTEICSILYEPDANGRQINIYKFNNVKCIGDNLYYPNVFLHSMDLQIFLNPSEERVMSLSEIPEEKINIKVDNVCKETIKGKYFYFVYNTDNYYHFLYDSLPYLISYFHLKKKNKNIKLLMNFSNFKKDKNYLFVDEILSLLGIERADIEIIKKDFVYEEVYVSSSYTYGKDPNAPPREEIYNLYDSIKKNILKNKSIEKLPEYVYISRRSWIHKDYSNIGTNYTDRRKMTNEDELVSSLKSLGFQEIFCENLSMIDKIKLFSSAKVVVGAIGGGLSNVLFSPKYTKLVCIVSPGFFKYNKRFSHCFSKITTSYFDENKHAQEDKYKDFMRVMTNDGIIGEIINTNEKYVTIKYLEEKVAGWNKDSEYKNITVDQKDIKWTDNGINSPWICDIEKTIKQVKSLIQEHS
jgi:hypothetical protein